LPALWCRCRVRPPGLVEAHLDIRPLIKVHGIHKPHLPVIQGKNHRRSSHAFAKKPHTLQKVPVRHTGTRKNHFLPRRQIFRVVNSLGIFHTHFFKPYLIFRFANHQPRQDLPVQAAQRGGRQHPFRRAPDTHHRVHSRPDHRCRDSR